MPITLAPRHGSGLVYCWQPRTTSARGWVSPEQRRYPTKAEGFRELNRIFNLKPDVIYVLPIMKKPEGGCKQIHDPNNPFNYVYAGPEVHGSDFSVASLWDHDPHIPWISEAMFKLNISGIDIMRDVLMCISPDAPNNQRWMADMRLIGPPDHPDKKWMDIRGMRFDDFWVQEENIKASEQMIREGASILRMDGIHLLRSLYPKYVDRFIYELRRKFPQIKFMAETLGSCNPNEQNDYFTGKGCSLLGNFHWEVMDSLDKADIENYIRFGRKDAIDFISTHDDIPRIITHSCDDDARAFSNCLLYMLALAKQGKWGLMQGFESVDKTPKSNILTLNTYDFSWPGAVDLQNKITWLSTLRSIYPAFNFGWTDFWRVNNDTVSCFMRGLEGSYKLFCAVNLKHDGPNYVEVLMPERFTLFEVNNPRVKPEQKDLLPKDENGYVKIHLGHPNTLLGSGHNTAARVFLVKETP